MGDWAIVIQGTGAHHNKDFPQDADRMTQRFVDDLVRAGHDIVSATFTNGGRTVVDTIDVRTDYLKGQVREDSTRRELVILGEQKKQALSLLGLGQSPRKDPVHPEPLTPEQETAAEMAYSAWVQSGEPASR